MLVPSGMQYCCYNIEPMRPSGLLGSEGNYSFVGGEIKPKPVQRNRFSGSTNQPTATAEVSLCRVAAPLEQQHMDHIAATCMLLEPAAVCDGNFCHGMMQLLCVTESFHCSQSLACCSGHHAATCRVLALQGLGSSVRKRGC